MADNILSVEQITYRRECVEAAKGNGYFDYGTIELLDSHESLRAERDRLRGERDAAVERVKVLESQIFKMAEWLMTEKSIAQDIVNDEPENPSVVFSERIEQIDELLDGSAGESYLRDLYEDKTALERENAALLEALQRIEQWEMPPTQDGKSYSYHYGSNGERDWIRAIARNALAAMLAKPTEPGVKEG